MISAIATIIMFTAFAGLALRFGSDSRRHDVR